MHPINDKARYDRIRLNTSGGIPWPSNCRKSARAPIHSAGDPISDRLQQITRGDHAMVHLHPVSQTCIRRRALAKLGWWNAAAIVVDSQQSLSSVASRSDCLTMLYRRNGRFVHWPSRHESNLPRALARGWEASKLWHPLGCRAAASAPKPA